MRRKQLDWGQIGVSALGVGAVVVLSVAILVAVWYANKRVYGDGSCMFVECVKVTPIAPVKP